MRRRVLTTVAALSAAAVSVAACSSGGSSSTPSSGSAASSSASGSASASASGQIVSGQSATFLVAADPGSLDPDLTTLGVTLQTDMFAYDSLIGFTPTNVPEANLATKWSGTTTTASFTLRKDVTCADGSPLTASTVAANINYIGDVKNASPRVGVWMPADTTATADNATGVVSVKSPTPDPFLTTDVGSTQIVCDKGMKDRGSLKEGTDGTGPYTLSAAVPGSSYTFTLRKDYTWGPGGVTSTTPGLPAVVIIKVAANMTTAANELLAGQANISEIIGSDASRLSGLYSHSLSLPMGELWFNEKAGSPVASLAVRKALTQAVQLSQLGQVLSAGTGKPSEGIMIPGQSPCVNDTVAQNTPTYDASAAKSALSGKKLSVALWYPSSIGAGATAAATLLQETWSQLGVSVSLHAATDAELGTKILGGTAAWDVAILPISLTSPSELPPYVSGAAPPKGGNFASLSNAAYTAEVAKASAIVGAAGCPDWNAAEDALIKNADVIPFVNSPLGFYAKGMTFQFTEGAVAPTSFRMLG